MSEVLNILLVAFVAFATCHYTLTVFIRNSTAVVVSAAIFAVLVVLFARGLVL